MKAFHDFGIEAPPSGTGEHYTTCPECSGTRTKKHDKCLSVNLDKGTWYCHHCGWSGGLPKDQPTMKQKQSCTVARPCGTVNGQPLTPDALEWLKTRGISPATAQTFGLQSCLWNYPKVDGQAPSIAVPFYRDGQLVNWKLRAIGTKAFSQSRGGQQCLYNWDAGARASTVILTEGEIDAWSIHEAGLSNVCSCPSGAPPLNARDVSGKLAFIEDAAAIFQDAERIILAGDMDAPGIAWQNAIAEKLGPERCLQVAWSSDCKDANDVLLSFGAQTLRECIANAAPVPVQGLATFADYRQQIMDYKAAGGLSRGMSTGWASVDEVIRLRRGTLNILTGIPSSGKSEWLDQLMLHTIRDHQWRWAVFSPENHPPAYHFGKLAEKWNGKPMFDCWGNDAISPEELDATVTGLSKYIHLLTFDEGPANVEGILNRLRSCARMHGIAGAVIDPWNELEHVRPSGMTETEHIGQSLTRFRNFARLHDVAIWIVAHPTKLQKKEDGSFPVPTAYDIAGSANWRNKADSCLAVWRDIAGDDPHRVQVHVQKIRDKHLGNIGMVELDWQPATGRFFETGRLKKAPAWIHTRKDTP